MKRPDCKATFFIGKNNYNGPKKPPPGQSGSIREYKGDNETYIEGPIGNDGIILYNSQMRDRLQTRRTKRNV